MDLSRNKTTEIFSGTLWEAEMIKNLLQEAGIDSFLNNSVHNSYAYNPIIASGVKVMIFESEAEKARKIVDIYYINLKGQ
jgi:hypothetical protein